MLGMVEVGVNFDATLQQVSASHLGAEVYDSPLSHRGGGKREHVCEDSPGTLALRALPHVTCSGKVLSFIPKSVCSPHPPHRKRPLILTRSIPQAALRFSGDVNHSSVNGNKHK